MIVKCHDCHINYNDEYRWTICPHDLLRTPEESARFDKAWDLLIRGRPLEWNHQPMPGEDRSQPLRISSVYGTGMITFYGVSGQFDPDTVREIS